MIVNMFLDMFGDLWEEPFNRWLDIRSCCVVNWIRHAGTEHFVEMVSRLPLNAGPLVLGANNKHFPISCLHSRYTYRNATKVCGWESYVIFLKCLFNHVWYAFWSYFLLNSPIKPQIEWNFENKYSPAVWKRTIGKYCLTGVLKILQPFQTCNNSLLVPLLKIVIKLWLTTQFCEFSSFPCW